MEYFLSSSVLEESWTSFNLFLNFECKYNSAKKLLILSGFSQRSSCGCMDWTSFSLTTVHLKRGI